MEKVRTFIAIGLPPEIIANIKELQEELKKSNAKVRWVKPENIHLTLKFLGHLPPEQLEKVKITARETLQPFKPFGISISGLGAFPKIKYPRVVWIGIDKGKEEIVLELVEAAVPIPVTVKMDSVKVIRRDTDEDELEEGESK